MFKFKVIAFILLVAVLISGEAYCQQAMNDGPVSVISGKIINVDEESGAVNVQTDEGKRLFYIVTESGLFVGTHHMSIIEIDPGDLVTIQYQDLSGKNEVISLVDNKSKSE